MFIIYNGRNQRNELAAQKISSLIEEKYAGKKAYGFMKRE